MMRDALMSIEMRGGLRLEPGLSFLHLLFELSFWCDLDTDDDT